MIIHWFLNFHFSYSCCQFYYWILPKISWELLLFPSPIIICVWLETYRNLPINYFRLWVFHLWVPWPISLSLCYVFLSQFVVVAVIVITFSGCFHFLHVCKCIGKKLLMISFYYLFNTLRICRYVPHFITGLRYLCLFCCYLIRLAWICAYCHSRGYVWALISIGCFPISSIP